MRRDGLGVGCLPSSPGGAAGRRHAQQVVHCGATTRWCVPGGAFTSPDGRQMPVVTVCAVQGRQGCHPGMRLELLNRAGTRPPPGGMPLFHVKRSETMSGTPKTYISPGARHGWISLSPLCPLRTVRDAAPAFEFRSSRDCRMLAVPQDAPGRRLVGPLLSARKVGGPVGASEMPAGVGMTRGMFLLCGSTAPFVCSIR